MKMILAPIDFSPISERVVATAADLARSLNGYVVLLHIVALPHDSAESAVAINNYSSLVGAIDAAADEQLANFQARLNGQGVASQVIRLAGFPHVLIPEQANKLSADFVVMGSHGHTALYDLIVGNTTRAVIKHVGCPVIVVPARLAVAAGEPAVAALHPVAG